MAGFAIFSATIWTGANIAGSFDLGTMIWISIIGNIILTIYIALLGYIGGETGLSTHELSKKFFGKYGFYLTSSLAMLAQLGWFGVGVMMFTQPIINFISINSNISDSNLEIIKWAIILSSGALMISTAFVGIKALKWVSMIAVPLVLIFGFTMMIMAATSSAGSNWDPNRPGLGDYTQVQAIGLVFATFVSGGTLAPDFVRWAKNGKHAVISIVVSFLVCSTLMLIFGSFAFYGTGDNDLSAALITMGLAPIGIIVLGANIWTTNDNGLYTQGLAASSITGIEKKYNIIFLGIVGTLFSPIFNNYFIEFLGVLNLMLPGIGALLILNGFILKEENQKEKINYMGVIAWVTGLLISLGINMVLPFIVPIYVIIFTILIYLPLYFTKKYWIKSQGEKNDK